VQTAGRVDQNHISLHLNRCLDRIKGHSSRICAFPVGTDRGHAHALTPCLQLVGRGRPEGVCGAQHDVLVLSHQDARQLSDCGRLACPVDADHHHHGRTALDPRGGDRAIHREVHELEQILTQPSADRLLVTCPLDLDPGAQRVDQLHRRLDTQVRAEQSFLDVLP